MTRISSQVRRIPAVLALCGIAFLLQQAQAMTFRTSSIGYHTQAAKFVVLEDIPSDQNVEVVLYDPNKRNPKLPVLMGAAVFKIEKTRVYEDTTKAGPATKNLLLNFSDFKMPGTYELRVEGSTIKSDPVKIGDYLYWDTLKPVVKGFYFQRCGQEVEERTLKLFHSACHLKDADFIFPPKGMLDGDTGQDVIGGWHNGGDYAKYVTSTALSAARLMSMHEWDPKPFKYFRLEYPLFEPGYGSTDDLHHEIKAGLDWLIAMQRRDGAVYRKVAGKQWPGKILPEDDEQRRFIYGISTQDTANAAAVWAMAARDFKKADLGYSVKSLLQAEKAWGFLESRPEFLVQRSDSDFSGSGEFINPNSRTDTPYRFWAAAELYIATGKLKYHQYFLQHLNEISLERFSWTNPAILGITDYLLYAKNQDAKTADTLKSAILRLADELADSAENDLYGVGLSKYGMSSNQEIAERAAILMSAYRLSGQAYYRDVASRMASYFFGVNPMGMTYITGFPGKAVAHPSHRWVEASGKPVLGYVVDGPNDYATDGKTPVNRGAASYADDAAAKLVNEPKILNNASLAFLLAVLNDAYNVSPPEETGPKSPLEFELAPERPKKK